MRKDKKADSISTFLGADAAFDGTIEFQGTIRVDGKIKGKISSNGGTVIVGEKAVVDAEIFVSHAIVMGEVNGTIVAKDRIEVFPPGRVGGEIQAPVISIEPGGIFNGSCVMKGQKDTAGKPTAAPRKPETAAESATENIKV